MMPVRLRGSVLITWEGMFKVVVLISGFSESAMVKSTASILAIPRACISGIRQSIHPSRIFFKMDRKGKSTREQREVLDALAIRSLRGFLMRNVSRTEYVEMDIREEDRSIHVKMPYGEMKQSLTTGGDRKTPVRVENHILPMLTDVKTCHTHFWRYQGDRRQFDYCNRNGVWANFTFIE